MSPKTAAEWTDVGEVLARLRRRWDRGVWLADHAAGAEFEPVRIPVRGPRADELLDRLDAVHGWLERFGRDARRAGFRIETKIVQGRRVGRNELPARLWVDSLPQLTSLLGVGDQIAALDHVRQLAASSMPRLTGWINTHPALAIEYADRWADLQATARWIADHEPQRHYLRHLDLEGIDTKFVENHRQILSELLDRLLPAERVDERFARTDIAGRYGFLRRPSYLRFRVPPGVGFPSQITEATIRTDEFARLDLPHGRVLVVENEASYLALPDLDDTVIIFGSGFALTTLKAVTWLADRELIYWGDIDTYGFAILDQLRARFDHVRSVLMDHDTLLSHRQQWVTEPRPTARPLSHLTEPEAELYADLIEDRFGHLVRLEQERIRFSRVRSAVAMSSQP